MWSVTERRRGECGETTSELEKNQMKVFIANLAIS